MVEVITLARSLSHSGKYRVPTVAFRDVVNQFHDDHRFAHPRSTKRADLSSFGKGADQIDDLDTGFQNARTSVLLQEGWRLTMDRIPFLECHRSALVYRVAGNIENATKNSVTHRNRNRGAGIRNGHPPL